MVQKQGFYGLTLSMDMCERASVCSVAFGLCHIVFGCLQGVDYAFDMQMNRFYSQANGGTPPDPSRPAGSDLERPVLGLTNGANDG